MTACLADHLVILILGLGLDLLFGDMPWLFAWIPHPIILMGKAIKLLDLRLNRPERSPSARRMRGIIMLLGLVTLAGAVGAVFSVLSSLILLGPLLQIFLVGVFVAQRSLYDHVGRVKTALEKQGLDAGREAVSHIVGRDPLSLDSFGVARAGIESLAENFADGVVAPAFFYVLGGLPGLFIYKMVNTLDSMVGYLNPRYRDFGWASARFDDLLNLIPARLSGLFLVLAAGFVSRGAPWRAFRTMLRDAGKHRSPNSGWPEAAMAGALDLALAGPRRYGDLMVRDPWLGDGRARATPADMHRAMMVFAVAGLIQVLLAAVLALILTA